MLVHSHGLWTIVQHSLGTDLLAGLRGYRPKESLGDMIFFIIIVALLVLMAGLMSGLTLGLLSLSKTDLEVLRRSGTPQERIWAARIEPVLRRPHFLLVTLVLCNAAATEALPIFLDRLLDPVTAVLISIVVVLIFGEIIPQAICTRYGLAVGAYSAWFVRALMWVCGVVAFPISKLLDWVLGSEHDALFRRAQLKALVSIHSREEGLGGTLTSDEIAIIGGALDMTGKTASACMTPLDKVFMLSADTVLDEGCLLRILDSGHSRIPVHRPARREDIMGLLLVKELILIDKNAGTLAGEVRMRGLPYLKASTSLYEILHLFESGRCHMAVLIDSGDAEAAGSADEQLDEVIHVRVENEQVEQQPILNKNPSEAGQVGKDILPGVLGILTIEDVLEELLQVEIIDETDKFVDNEGLHRVNAGLLLKQLPPHLRKVVRSRQFLPRVGPLNLAGVDHNVDHKLENARVAVAEAQAAGNGRLAGRSRPVTPSRIRLVHTAAPRATREEGEVREVAVPRRSDLTTPFLESDDRSDL